MEVSISGDVVEGAVSSGERWGRNTFNIQLHVYTLCIYIIYNP